MIKSCLHLALSTVAVLGISGPAVAFADVPRQASACHVIGDADARAYCLAKAHREPARCYAVQRPDLRALCRAEAQR